MFRDKELRRNFSGIQDVSGSKKSKWYMILDHINTKLYPDLDLAMWNKVAGDTFWTDEEKRLIKRAVYGEEVKNWTVECRVFGGGEHLDFCVIYCPKLIYKKRRKGGIRCRK